MKKYIISLVMIICACTMVLAGCGSKGLKDNPATDAAIIGNGGFAIEKGDYLYYINGFVDDYTTVLDDYKKDNVFGKVVYGAIYRTKLNNGRFSKNEKGFLNKTECVVSKVVGYENGGFYIVGDYIYYATPYMKEDGKGVLQNDRISINRIKIDGTANKEVYVTTADATDLDWHVNVIGGKTYIIVLENTDDGKVVKSICDNGKKFPVKTGARGYDSIAFEDNVNLGNEYFYYTRTVTDDEKNTYNTSGNLIVKASLVTGQDVKVTMLDSESTFNLIDYANGILYTTRSISGTKTYLYGFDVSQNLEIERAVKLSNDEYTSYYTIAGVPYSVMAIDSNNNLIKFENRNNEVLKSVISASITTVVKIDDGFVYYLESSNLYRIPCEGGEKQTVSGVGEATDKAFLLEDATAVDIDGRYVYVYASYTAEDGETTSYYLNRIDTLQTTMTAEFVGCMTSEHMVKDPNVVEDESEDEGEEEKEFKQWVY